jgi:hypothetical protein
MHRDRHALDRDIMELVKVADGSMTGVVPVCQSSYSSTQECAGRLAPPTTLCLMPRWTDIPLPIAYLKPREITESTIQCNSDSQQQFPIDQRLY